MEATDWQPHSVRGFSSGSLTKKMGLKVESTKREDGAFQGTLIRGRSGNIMIISVVNMTDGALKDAEIQNTIRAVNRQLAGDFALYWGYGSQLRLEGRTGLKKGRFQMDAADMRGDGVLYLRDIAKVRDTDGFHNNNFAGIPYGVVYLDLSRKLGEDWTVTLSHEALELTGDPENNLLVQGPHPAKPDKLVYHWYEMCDAVQAETYRIDGVAVSNFVLPLYFTSSAEHGGRNDFLGTVSKGGKTLRSFSVNPGGYIGFFDPSKKRDVTFELADDPQAKARLAAKREVHAGRGHRRGLRSAVD